MVGVSVLSSTLLLLICMHNAFAHDWWNFEDYRRSFIQSGAFTRGYNDHEYLGYNPNMYRNSGRHSRSREPQSQRQTRTRQQDTNPDFSANRQSEPRQTPVQPTQQTTRDRLKKVRKQFAKFASTSNLASPTGSRCPDFIARAPDSCERTASYRTIDGSCNNLRHKDWGQSKTPLMRFLTAEYEDSEGAMKITGRNGRRLPSTRKVSINCEPLAAAARDSSPDFTHMHMLYGQFIDHDISHTPLTTKVKCCTVAKADRDENCIPIDIDRNDEYWSTERKTCMELRRSRGIPAGQCGQRHREQLNDITSFIDASTIYGSDHKQANALRERRGGRLKVSYGNHLPQDKPEKQCDIPAGHSNQRCYMTGDKRVNVWAGLTAMHLIFHREHNRIAHILGKQIRKKNKYMHNKELDEKIYQETRRIIGAQLQVITYKEYLPKVLGSRTMRQYGLDLTMPYRYDTDVDPRVANVFATAAFRFGHAQIPFGTQPKDREYKNSTRFLTYTEMFNQPGTYDHAKQEDLLRGIVLEPGLKDDNKFSDEVRDKLFMRSFNGSGLDLPAVNSQRGRDHGLPPYTSWRNFCGLSSVDSFTELTDHSRAIQDDLSRIYSDVQDIDLFTGGITENHAPGATVGPTFACIIAKQFEKLKKGDRYWFQSQNSYSHPFSSHQISELSKITLAKVLCSNHHMQQILVDVFSMRSETEHCDQLPSINLHNWI